MSEEEQERLQVPGTFPAERWRRAGATDDEVDALGQEFAALHPSAQDAAARQVAAVSDYELRDRLEARRNPEPAPSGPETGGGAQTGGKAGRGAGGAQGGENPPADAG